VCEKFQTLLHQRVSSAIKPLHHAAALTNPQLWDLDQHLDDTMKEGFERYAATVFKGRDDAEDLVVKAVSQLMSFKEKDGAWGTDRVAAATAEACRPWVPPDVTDHMSYVRWWMTYGKRCKELKEVAMRALSQAISICASERGHQVHKFLHNKRRNRMKAETADKLVFCHTTLRLKRKQQELAEADEGVEDEDETDLELSKAKRQVNVTLA